MSLTLRIPAGSLRIEHAGQRVTLAGWVQKQRDFGELVFIDLRDRSGICQVVADQERGGIPEAVARAKELRPEFVVRVTGTVVERSPEQRNAKLPTGDVELLAEEIEVLNTSDTPPFPIDDETNAAEDLRLRHRYLDLRRPSLQANMILRNEVVFRTRDYMHRKGFLEIETPILTKSTPEGARDFLVPSRVNRGEFYALPQSPQIFKQLLMVSGMERYYQIARCFRDEDLRRDRQPEFTQVDVEASFIDEEFIFELIEGLFESIFPAAGIEVKSPFPRMTWHEAMERYGIDRPDTRFGMELQNISDWAAGIDFAPFKAAGQIKAIVVPKGAAFSRKRIDELTEFAKLFKAPGLIWVKFDEQRGSSIKKFISDDQHAALREALKAGSGDLALIVAGNALVVADALANLRLRVAREEKLIPENLWNFLWVVDFPLFEWDEETQRWFARHHPFTSPAGEAMNSLSDPATALARAYDVVLNGLELGGGSIRINRAEVQRMMFKTLSITEEEARARFGFLLDAFRYGAPPHGGIALGVDRMVMLMAGADSLRDVIAFPKTTTGQDLMSGAPSDIPDGQLDELGITLRKK